MAAASGPVTISLMLEGNLEDGLIMHNGRLADREYEWTKRLALFTAKRKKTEEDHVEIARLEWLGGLYYAKEIGPYLPGDNVRRSLLDAARLSRDGKSIERGLLSITRVNFLDYPGPRHAELLWADRGQDGDKTGSSRFVDRRGVRVGTGRITRTRPIFFEWSTIVGITINPNVLDPEALVRIASTAGQLIGLCDGRPFYGGRFEARQATEADVQAHGEAIDAAREEMSVENRRQKAA